MRAGKEVLAAVKTLVAAESVLSAAPADAANESIISTLRVTQAALVWVLEAEHLLPAGYKFEDMLADFRDTTKRRPH